jgi:N-acetylglutamate synthase-like GNAT family acetyltransferase
VNNIIILANADQDKIKQVYDAVGYKGGIQNIDVGFLATIADQPVGAVRICKENDVYVLRGMMVKPEFQRHGVGKALLEVVNNYLGETTCYCINPTHLKNFYGRIGFEQIDTDVVPAFLVERMERYNADNYECITMLRGS